MMGGPQNICEEIPMLTVGEEYHYYNIQPFSKALADYFIHMIVYQSSVKGSPGDPSFFFIKDAKDILASANGAYQFCAY